MAVVISEKAKEKVGLAFSEYMRRESNSFITGGVSVQVNAIKRLGFATRPATDLDVVIPNFREPVVEVSNINADGYKFKVFMINSNTVSTPFHDLILDAKDPQILLCFQGKEKAPVQIIGNMSYEAIESHLPKKAYIISRKLNERRGEIGKDMFDIAVLCSSLNGDFLSIDKNIQYNVNEIFYISSSLGRLYMKDMAKRTGCPVAIADPARLVNLAEIGRDRFYTTDRRIMQFADVFPAVFPSMLLAANNVCDLKSKIPVIIEHASRNDPRIAEINYFGLIGLLRDDNKMLQRAFKRALKEFGESPKAAA